MIRFIAYILASWLVTISGLIVVPVALLFRKPVPGTLQKFTQYVGWWELVRLPKWALWWDNAYDGMLGDKRGWWNWHTGNCRSFWSMYKWAAIRNSANYFSRNIIGCDVSDCVIVKAAGVDVVDENPGSRQWQLLRALDSKGRFYFRFYLVWAYPFRPDKGVMIDMGWKIKLAHNGTAKDAPPQDRYKGIVFTPSFWKAL